MTVLGYLLSEQDLVLVYLFIAFSVICGLIAYFSPQDAALRNDRSGESDSSSSDRRDTF